MSFDFDNLDQRPVHNPLDRVEDLVMGSDLEIARMDDGELLLSFPGLWTTHQIHIAWDESVRLLQFSSAIELHIRPQQHSRVDRLLSLVNQRLGIGHFEICIHDHCIAFRHGLLLRGQDMVANEQIEDMIEIVTSEIDRFFPAFQWVVWDSRDPEEALEAAMIETLGEA